jgi:hypothetical protein
MVLVFASNFKEGQDSPATCDCGRPLSQSASVRSISTDEPFESLYPVLYYLYTDRIYFTTIPIEEATPLYHVPPCDAEDAYRLGDMLGLADLKEKALAFLSDTYQEHNIIEKVLGECALNYEEVGKKCEAVFYEHWNSIRKRGDLKAYFENSEREGSEQRKKITARCIDLMEGLASQGQRAA